MKGRITYQIFFLFRFIVRRLCGHSSIYRRPGHFCESGSMEGAYDVYSYFQLCWSLLC